MRDTIKRIQSEATMNNCSTIIGLCEELLNDSNSESISVKEKSVYGNVLLYPNNQTAHLFAQLIGKKTFTANDLDLIVAGLGYDLDLIKLP